MQISGCPETGKQEGDRECKERWKLGVMDISVSLMGGEWALSCFRSAISASWALRKGAGQLLHLNESAQKLDLGSTRSWNSYHRLGRCSVDNMATIQVRTR